MQEPPDRMVAHRTHPTSTLPRSHADAALAKVAELGSFRRAALVLGLPSTAVAAMIHRLERRCGHALLVRDGHFRVVTREGAAYLQALAMPPADGGDGDADDAPAAGHLSIEASAGEARAVLLPGLARLAARYPAVAITVHAVPRTLSPWPADLDAALRLGHGLPADDTAVQLGEYRRVTCASPAYLAQHGTPTDLQGLAAHRAIPLIEVPGSAARALQFDHGGTIHAVELPYVVASDDIGAQLAATLAGLGISQLPLTQEVRSYLTSRRLVAVLESYPAGSVPIFLWHRAAPSPALRAFRSWLADLYRSECLRLSPRR